jgi:hypothetical protein
MATFEKNEYKFPDEIESKEPEDTLEIEIEDDTPAEDRGRQPMPQEIVQELEADELEEYSEKAKERLKQYKKVWNDERREKDTARRLIGYLKKTAALKQPLKRAKKSTFQPCGTRLTAT